MGDIMLLYPLKTAVQACGQVRFCVREDVDRERHRRRLAGLNSVSTVLLVVRYGKYPLDGLDDLSHRQGPRTDTEAAYRADMEVGLT